HLEPDAHDPVGPELVGLLLHPRHRELARVVHGLRQHVELLVASPASQLQADVVDRATTTRPSGSNPACLTSRNSLTERSLVKKRPDSRMRRSRSRPASGMPSTDVGS